ncbi:IL18 protein, partial [Rhinopomastus cyanomelas]|nr:IL18 protein [Rhinopomastus cyanomelas]
RVKMSSEEVHMYTVKLGDNFCLYFEELECDAFCKSNTLSKVLRNVHSQLLVVRPDLNEAAFENMTDHEMETGNGTSLDVHYYDSSTDTPPAGKPVAFTIRVKNKCYYMCCEEECGKMIVRFREGEVPTLIPDKSNAIFFRTKFTSSSPTAYKFEYSLEQGMFLAFEEEGNLRKLILKKVATEDEVDETMKMSL